MPYALHIYSSTTPYAQFPLLLTLSPRVCIFKTYVATMYSSLVLFANPCLLLVRTHWPCAYTLSESKYLVTRGITPSPGLLGPNLTYYQDSESQTKVGSLIWITKD